MTTAFPTEKTFEVNAEHFTDDVEDYAAVNLRVGMIDVDLSPESAADLGRRLIEGANLIRHMALPQ